MVRHRVLVVLVVRQASKASAPVRALDKRFVERIDPCAVYWAATVRVQSFDTALVRARNVDVELRLLQVLAVDWPTSLLVSGFEGPMISIRLALFAAFEAHHSSVRLRRPAHAPVSRVRTDLSTLLALAVIVHVRLHHTRERKVAPLLLGLKFRGDDLVDALCQRLDPIVKHLEKLMVSFHAGAPENRILRTCCL